MLRRSAVTQAAVRGAQVVEMGSLGDVQSALAAEVEAMRARSAAQEDDYCDTVAELQTQVLRRHLSCMFTLMTVTVHMQNHPSMCLHGCLLSSMHSFYTLLSSASLTSLSACQASLFGRLVRLSLTCSVNMCAPQLAEATAAASELGRVREALAAARQRARDERAAVDRLQQEKVMPCRELPCLAR